MASLIQVFQLKHPNTGEPVSPVVNVGSIFDKKGQKVDNLLSYRIVGTDLTIPQFHDVQGDLDNRLTTIDNRLNNLDNEINNKITTKVNALNGTMDAATLGGSTKSQIISSARYTHPTTKQCSYSYVHPESQQCSNVDALTLGGKTYQDIIDYINTKISTSTPTEYEYGTIITRTGSGNIKAPATIGTKVKLGVYRYVVAHVTKETVFIISDFPYGAFNYSDVENPSEAYRFLQSVISQQHGNFYRDVIPDEYKASGILKFVDEGNGYIPFIPTVEQVFGTLDTDDGEKDYTDLAEWDYFKTKINRKLVSDGEDPSKAIGSRWWIQADSYYNNEQHTQYYGEYVADLVDTDGTPGTYPISSRSSAKPSLRYALAISRSAFAD